jgi:hypothetical protein
MANLEKLEQVARAAEDVLRFEKDEPASYIVLKDYRHAMGPSTALRLLAVVRAAKETVYPYGFDADKTAALMRALNELEQP